MRTIEENTLKWLFLLLVLIILWVKRAKISTVEKLSKFFPFLKPFVKWFKKVSKDKELRLFWSIFFINLIIKEIIDALLTPLMMINFGYITCLLTTISIYAFIGIFSLKKYDSYGKDIFWIQALKKAQNNKQQVKSKNYLTQLVLKRNKKNKFFIGLLFSFKNLAVGVIYLRSDDKPYNGFAGRKIKFYFVGYLLIMNIYWNTVVYLGISFWRPIWNLIKLTIWLNFKIYI